MSTPTSLSHSDSEKLWNRLRDLFSKLDEAQVDQDTHLRAAYQSHNHLASAVNVKELHRWQEVLELYRKTLDSVKQESKCLSIALKSLAELDAMLNQDDTDQLSRQSLEHKKLKKRISATEIKRPLSKFQSIPIEAGSEVAARTLESQEYTWIWAKVLSIQEDEYTIQDLDNQKIKRVTEHDLIPLTPADYPDFSVGSEVFAIYPETTVFYKAVVHNVKDGVYLLQFEDDSGQYQKIPKRNVVAYDASKIPRR